MNYKLLSLFLLTVFLVSAVSALDLTLVSSPASVAHDSSPATVTFNITNEDFFTVTDLVFSYSSSTGSYNLPTITSIAADSTQLLTASLTFPKYTSGSITSSITVTGKIGSTVLSDTMTIPVINIIEQKKLVLSASGELSRSSNSTLTIKNDGNVNMDDIDLTYNAASLRDSSGRQASLVFSDDLFDLAKGASKTVAISADVPSNFELGDYSTVLTAKAADGTTSNLTLTLKSSFCKFGELGSDLKITRIRDESSDDDWEWKPLDNVQINIRVENNGDNDEDVTVKIALYDISSKSFIDIDNDEEDVSIDEDESEDVIFNIEVPEDIDEGDYRLYAKAFIEGDEDQECTESINGDNFQSISIDRESREIKLSSFIMPESFSCGSTQEISFRVYNTGTRDEDKVKVRVFNNDLGIDEEKIINNFDSGDSEKITISFDIPSTVTAKNYDLQFISYFDYDEDDEEYGESDTISKTIKVEGSCVSVPTQGSLQISAILESENVIEGREFEVKATLRNTGSETTTYTLLAELYDTWATLDSIEPSTLTLQAGASADVIFTLTAKDGSAGEHSFNIKAAYSGKTTTQPLSLTVEENQGFGITGSAILESIKANWLIWVIVLINIVLIIAIILVAKKLSN